MHHTRFALNRLRSDPEEIAASRFHAAKDFTIGWLAGLIFFGTFLS